MHKIPVTVVTGFLGAGKTTLIRHLLQNPQGRRLAVVVNEFGEMGIDGDLLRSCQVCEEEDSQSNIIELTNGCLCCTVQEEFYPTMVELVQRRDNIDSILIETSGLALPKPLIQAFRWQEIRQKATVDGVITVVDVQALASGRLVGNLEALEEQRQSDPNLDHETPLEELFEDQLLCADLVLLTKTDLVEENEVERVKQWLKRELSPNIKLIPCHQGEINPEILLGFNARVEEHLEQRPSHHDTEDEHEHDEEINSVELVVDGEFKPEELLKKLQDLVEKAEIYRIKGFVAVPQKPMRLVLQGVGHRFDTFYDRFWHEGELRQTRLVFIGRGLSVDWVKSYLFDF